MGSLGQTIGDGPALFVAGAIVLAMVALRVVNGESFVSRPAMRISRTEDTFGFWLGIAIPGATGVALCAIALAMLSLG